MPPPVAGIIIAASVLVAAGIAAYENPQFREWLERSREKIAVAFNSVGHDGRHQRSTQNDRSMSEDQDEKAEERRRQARQEILERGRLLQERERRRKTSTGSSSVNEKRTPSFDHLVDQDGKLRPEVSGTVANSSAVETHDMNGLLRSRHMENESENRQENIPNSMHDSVDTPMQLRQLNNATSNGGEWESRYEQEMRNTWNIPLPERTGFAPSTHASESLIDLTPTTEDFPDPDVSIPSLSDLQHPLDRTEYFSIPPSRTSRTMSEAGTDSDHYYTHPSHPLQPIEPRSLVGSQTMTMPSSLAASVNGSIQGQRPHEFESEDDLSEFGDGVRTPASAWTEVGSTVSGDA